MVKWLVNSTMTYQSSGQMTLSMKPKTTAYDQKSRKSFFSFGFGSTKTLSSIRRKTTAMTGMSTPRFPAFWEDFRGSLPEPADSEHHFWVSAHRAEKLMIIRLWCKITCYSTFRTRRLFNFQTNVDKHFQDLWIKKGTEWMDSDVKTDISKLCLWSGFLF